jgi:hypothetical protein
MLFREIIVFHFENYTKYICIIHRLNAEYLYVEGSDTYSESRIVIITFHGTSLCVLTYCITCSSYNLLSMRPYDSLSPNGYAFDL